MGETRIHFLVSSSPAEFFSVLGVLTGAAAAAAAALEVVGAAAVLAADEEPSFFESCGFRVAEAAAEEAGLAWIF
jgi:hypothetical protein